MINTNAKRIFPRSFLRSLTGLLLLHTFVCTAQSQPNYPGYLRADQSVSFKWRYGYSEFPFPQESPTAQEDALRGKFGWYDGALWSAAYKTWNDSTVHGVQLLFRGGSPYAREIKCTSELVPYTSAGTPVSFLLPFNYTIGSEEDIAFSFRVKGNGEEAIVCKLRPQAINTFTAGMFKVSFITMKVTTPTGTKPLLNVSGMMHIRVYPQLLNYGDRTEFIFSSVTHHMDVESSLVLGSLYRNMSAVDPYAAMNAVRLSPDSIATALQRHDAALARWRQATAKVSADLMQKGRIEIDCNGPTTKRDKGELRVMAYSGNPVKDFQYGTPTPQTKEMAQAVTAALGKRFSLFRYQHHYLPWKMENPSALDSSQLIYLRQWLEVAKASADTVVLDLQLSPIVKLYKQYTEMGRIALPANGIPGAEWKKITQGYLTTLQYAKKICPSLRIIQMPYELDNITNGSVHSDAHYQFYKALYEAVAIFNRQQAADGQVEIAGLGSNNPNSRWGFIDGFLQRYSADTSKNKRLDYITWHTYLFPGNYPSMIKGVGDSLQNMLKKYGLDPRLPVLVDEMGLAEPSTIEDLSDLQGAMKKEAAMAAYTTALHSYYEAENANITPISGAGWHFALLTYGKQNVLSTYAKGMLLRSRLGDVKIPVVATPVDGQGYGLHAVATKEKNKISILVYCASPSIFFENAAELGYADISVLLKDLPDHFKNTKLKITESYSSAGDAETKKILAQDKYQTLPLTRGADRYEKNFTAEEVKILNKLAVQSKTIVSGRNELNLSVSIDAYGMRLIEIEPVTSNQE